MSSIPCSIVASTAHDDIVHHIRISTDNEINAPVKPESLP
jgi:hypothetical protein